MQKRNQAGCLAFEDIHAPDFDGRHPDLSFAQAMAILHARRPDGSLLTGLDVTVEAWTLLGYPHWVAPLRWRWLRPLSGTLYRLFARHRTRLLQPFRREAPCSRCQD